MATVIVTGGGGFLGQCLASEILERGSIETEHDGPCPVARMVLADINFPERLQPRLEQASSIITTVTGSVADASFCNELLLSSKHVNEDCQHVSIFHLGAVMSGDGERDFDLCMNVNLFGFINILQAARVWKEKKKSGSGSMVKLVFASAGATIGSGAPTDYITRHDIINDAARATPHTTYGTTKACCELLLADFTRRGFVDARGVRLPTICVRAGAPNAATTSCFSGVVREPLAGIDVVNPIARDVPHAVTGKRAAIRAMLTLHDAKKQDIDATLGFDRTVFLPSVAVSLGDLEDALFKVVSPSSRSKLGKIHYEVDRVLSDVVGSFPTKIDASRAIQLGIAPAPDAETLVREYMADFPSAVAPGIELASETADVAIPASLKPNTNDSAKVAVVTGAGSGIGRAVSVRLASGGWNVVLAGRRKFALEETASLIGNHSGCTTCVPTDVTKQTDVEHLFQMVETEYGKVDLLFNNAGIGSAAASVPETQVEDFERVIQTNLVGPFLCARAAMQLMAKQQTGGGGRIINNGSLSAQVPRPGSAPYTCSKHAISGLTKCIALDGRAINVACGQIDFGNVVSEISTTTNKAGQGALQANGSYLEEPFMTLKDAAESVWAMANLPLEANVLQMTVMATKMPLVGRG